mmetsp:Transcript_6350/g.15287  ORF Transcript_6350/g.15287 Transcript_6350/m.15287 type:complete len:332 (-) Transcript_6350:127-1122(-)
MDVPWEVIYLITLLILAWLLAAVAYFTRHTDHALDALGVKQTYTAPPLHQDRIDLYLKVKENFRRDFFPHEKGEEWMAQLQAHAKERLKFFLLQRAAGDIFVFHTISNDARGLQRLFLKGVITRNFWNTVEEAEMAVYAELDKVKLEASFIEPMQDPEALIGEATRVVWSNGGKVPPLDEQMIALANSPSTPPEPRGGGMGPPYPIGPMGPMGRMGMPGGPPMGMRPPGPPAQLPPELASGMLQDGVSWTQDGTEMEVSVVVPKDVKKQDIKVTFQKEALKIALSGNVVAEGQLAGECRPQECTWTVGSGKVIITLEKARPQPWKQLFVTS